MAEAKTLELTARRWTVDRLTGIGALLLLAVAASPAALAWGRLWIQRPEYSHGFLMVPAAAWLLWEKRDRFRQLQPKPSVLGAVVLAIGLAILLAGELLFWAVLAAYGLVLTLVGVVWGLRGWPTLRAALPAVVALALACPLPGRIQMAITWPLKHTAALLATGLFDVTGIPATLEGNVIHLHGLESLWIADACSGIHSLISLLALVVLGALLFRPRPWVFMVLLLSCVPIAVLVNALRLWLTGYLSVKVSPESAQGFFHTFEGFGLFLIAGLMLAGWAALLGRLWPRGDA